MNFGMSSATPPSNGIAFLQRLTIGLASLAMLASSQVMAQSGGDKSQSPPGL